jgi:hypothetical protein
MTGSDLTDEFIDRPHDYCKRILESSLAENFDISSEAVDRIDYLLNRYHVDCSEALKKQLRAARKDAPALLQHLSAKLNETIAAISSLSENPYARSAIFSALPEKFTGTASKTDDQIDRFNTLISATEEVAGIANLAVIKQEFSNGLPEFKRGADADPHLDMLILSLAAAVPDAIREAIVQESGATSHDSTLETSSARIAPYIAELLSICGITLTEKAIHNRLCSSPAE